MRDVVGNASLSQEGGGRALAAASVVLADGVHVERLMTSRSRY